MEQLLSNFIAKLNELDDNYDTLERRVRVLETKEVFPPLNEHYLDVTPQLRERNPGLAFLQSLAPEEPDID